MLFSFQLYTTTAAWEQHGGIFEQQQNCSLHLLYICEIMRANQSKSVFDKKGRIILNSRSEISLKNMVRQKDKGHFLYTIENYSKGTIENQTTEHLLHGEQNNNWVSQLMNDPHRPFSDFP